MASLYIRKTTRDLGYAWDARAMPTAPAVVSAGQLGRIAVAMLECRADNPFQPFYECLFVGGRRVTRVHQDIETYKGDLTDPLTWTIERVAGWVEVQPDQLLPRLQKGEAILVQVEPVQP